MGEESETSADELCRAYMSDGVRLDIVASRLGKGEWALAVLNEAGVASNWTEFFATGEAALNAGMKAIEEEGVEAFTSIEGFEYLQEVRGDGEPH